MHLVTTLLLCRPRTGLGGPTSRMGSRASIKERCLPSVVSETSGDKTVSRHSWSWETQVSTRAARTRGYAPLVTLGHLSSWPLVCQALNLIVPAATVCLGDSVNKGGALFQGAQSCWADTGSRVL